MRKTMETHPNIAGGNMRLNFPGRYRKHVGASTAELNSRSLGMKRISLVLLLLLFIPTAAMPQRYGRPYSLAAIPQLLLQVSVQKKTHYFSVYDLRKMPRSVLTETDPTTNQTHVYEGVALDRLVPTTRLNSAAETVEIEYGSHQTVTISGNDLDTRNKSIVVDTIDGKALPGYSPYDFVAKFTGKPAQIMTGVHRVTAKIPS